MDFRDVFDSEAERAAAIAAVHRYQKDVQDAPDDDARRAALENFSTALRASNEVNSSTLEKLYAYVRVHRATYMRMYRRIDRARRGPNLFGTRPLPPLRQWLLAVIGMTLFFVLLSPLAAFVGERLWELATLHSPLRVVMLAALVGLGFGFLKLRSLDRATYGAMECAFAVSGFWFALHIELRGAATLATIGSAIYVFVRGLDNAATGRTQYGAALEKMEQDIAKLEPEINAAEALLHDIAVSALGLAESLSESQASHAQVEQVVADYKAKSRDNGKSS